MLGTAMHPQPTKLYPICVSRSLVCLCLPYEPLSTPAAVHEHRMEAMTALWLVPIIPGTTAAAVTGALAKSNLEHAQSVLLLYLGEDRGRAKGPPFGGPGWAE